jgi:hypothetical protein
VAPVKIIACRGMLCSIFPSKANVLSRNPDISHCDSHNALFRVNRLWHAMDGGLKPSGYSGF